VRPLHGGFAECPPPRQHSHPQAGFDGMSAEWFTRQAQVGQHVLIFRPPVGRSAAPPQRCRGCPSRTSDSSIAGSWAFGAIEDSPCRPSSARGGPGLQQSAVGAPPLRFGESTSSQRVEGDSVRLSPRVGRRTLSMRSFVGDQGVGRRQDRGGVEAVVLLPGFTHRGGWLRRWPIAKFSSGSPSGSVKSPPESCRCSWSAVARRTNTTARTAPVVELLGSRARDQQALIRSYGCGWCPGTHPRARGESGRASSDDLFVALQQVGRASSSRSSKSRRVGGHCGRGGRACRPRPPAATDNSLIGLRSSNRQPARGLWQLLIRPAHLLALKRWEFHVPAPGG